MRAVYRNKIRSKETIQKAFLDLLEEKKDIRKITVTALIAKANINRGTFYNHYKDIHAIVDEIIDNLKETLVSTTDRLFVRPLTSNIPKIITEIAEYIEKNSQVYSVLIPYASNDMFIQLRTYFIEKIIENPVINSHIKNVGDNNVFLVYFINGTIAVFFDYFTGKLQCTFEQLIKTVEKIIFSNIKSD